MQSRFAFQYWEIQRGHNPVFSQRLECGAIPFELATILIDLLGEKLFKALARRRRTAFVIDDPAHAVDHEGAVDYQLPRTIFSSVMPRQLTLTVSVTRIQEPQTLERKSV